jgi:hypothetical protein
MQATTGLEPHFDSVDEISLEDMTTKVKDLFNSWNTGVLPALPPDLFATDNFAPTDHAPGIDQSATIPMITLKEIPADQQLEGLDLSEESNKKTSNGL